MIAQLSEAGSPVPLKIVHNQVLTPAQAADVDYALSFDNVPGGTAYPEAAWDRSIIAKTGTTNQAQSAFFIGSDPAVLTGGRDVHAEPVGPHEPDARRPADAGQPERRRLRR